MKAEPKPTQAEREANMRWWRMQDQLDRRNANQQPRKLG